MAESGARKREEFTQWALPHLDHVYTAGLYLTRNHDEAEDLVQETFLKAYRSWHQFTVGTNCRAWLMTILHNTFKNRYRERYRQQSIVEFDETVYEQSVASENGRHAGDPETLLAAQALDGEVERALKSLPLEFLEVIVMVDLQDLTYEETAAALGCPIGTVRSRLSRARQRLEVALREYAQEHGYTAAERYALR